MQNPWHYRNNVQLKVQYNAISKQFEFGFYAQQSNDIIIHKKCLIAQTTNEIICQIINQKLSNTQLELQKYLIEFWDELIIRTGENSREILIALSFNKCDKFVLKAEFKPVWQEVFDTINSEMFNLPERYALRSLWLLDQENCWNDKHLLDEEYFSEIVLGKRFQIYPRSFFQVNTKQTEIMFCIIREIVIKALKISNNSLKVFCHGQENNNFQTKLGTLYDLYCGTGTIGIVLSDLFKTIKGIDSFHDSVQNAQQNAKLNSINNAEYFCGKAETWLGKQQTTENDFIVVDPPRNGLDKALIHTLNLCKASNTIYVSCHPGTLARDLKMLKDKWQIKIIQPIDMFPWTTHVETVVLMSRNG